jgi:hypothetical protein
VRSVRLRFRLAFNISSAGVSRDGVGGGLSSLVCSVAAAVFNGSVNMCYVKKLPNFQSINISTICN